MNYIKKLKPHEFRIWHGKRPLLGQLDIELTERCNNKCIHCCINLPEDDAEARGREMSTDFVKDVITQAANLGCLTVRFTGGEPLLREDLAELYEFTRRLGMQVILFTNARLITPKLATLLAKIPPGRVVETRLGETVTGRLEAGDSTLGDSSYADVFLYRAAASGRVTIQRRSTDFDAYLVLQDADGHALASDDDGGSGTDAQLTYEVEAGKTYRIVANSYGDERSTGLYRLTLRPGS